MRKLSLVLAWFVAATGVLAQGVTLPSSSIAVTDDALSILTNPAWLGFRSGGELLLSFPYNDSSATEDLGLQIKLGPIGFSGEFVQNDLEFYNRYTFGMGFPLGSGFYAGVSYAWYRVVRWDGSWNFGLGYRPLPFLSVGGVALDFNQPNHAGNSIYPTYGLALALRPFGYRATLSGDLLFTKAAGSDYGDNLDPRLKLEMMPLDGVRLMGEYWTDSRYFGLGASLSVDQVTLGHFSRMDENGENARNVGYIHLISDRQPNLFSPGKHQIVEIRLRGKIRESEPPFSFFSVGESKTLQRLRKEIQHYADDPHVDGLLITFENPEIGWAQMQQIRRCLEDFKATGKKLIAYSEMYSQKDYYLATACDEIHILPVGNVDLKGIAAVMGYWKGALDKLGIGVQVVRRGDYKTAANSLAFEDTPEPEAEMLNWLLDDLYRQLCSKIGEGRNWTVQQVMEKIDAGAYTAKQALDAGLVDQLHYYDELTETLEDQKFKLVDEGNYWKLGEYKLDWPDVRIPRVAVIYAEGAIVSGESGQSLFGNTYMGSETIAAAIRDARKDNSIDAIILRVNSPGGSGIASDVIYREVKKTVSGKEKKPLIVSMGNVAGSGGYYISMGADTIIAEESTITGSIGVILFKPNLEGLHRKIYYNSRTFKRGEHADAYNLNRPFTDEEMKMMDDAIGEFYDDFVAKVAQSRRMTRESVDSVAAGRVWTGKQAQEKGLVDLLGGMDLAFDIVRSKLSVAQGAPLNVEYYPKPRGFFAETFVNAFQAKQKSLPAGIAEALEPLELALELYDGMPLLLMPYQIEMK